MKNDLKFIVFFLLLSIAIKVFMLYIHNEQIDASFLRAQNEN